MLNIVRPYKWGNGGQEAYNLYKEEWSKFLGSLTRKQRAAIQSDRFTHEDTLKILGIDSKFNTNWRAWGEEYSEYSAGRKMIEWVKAHIGESDKRLAIKEAYSDTSRARKAIEQLKSMDSHSEYDRDDRVSDAYLGELLGISREELNRLYDKYGDTSRRRAVYDDTCGIGGGHHTYVGWTTKIFCALSFIRKIVHMYDVQEVK